MRSDPVVTVRCDGKDCYLVLQVGRYDVDGEMEKVGWTTTWGLKDYCPRCTKEREGEGE